MTPPKIADRVSALEEEVKTLGETPNLDEVKTTVSALQEVVTDLIKSVEDKDALIDDLQKEVQELKETPIQTTPSLSGVTTELVSSDTTEQKIWELTYSAYLGQVFSPQRVNPGGAGLDKMVKTHTKQAVQVADKAVEAYKHNLGLKRDKAHEPAHDPLKSILSDGTSE